MARTLVHALRDSVNSRPDAIAFIHRQAQTTYGDLWRDVESLAALLREGGLRPGERVGVLIENCPQYAAAYYSVLAAGGVVVGLNASGKARGLASSLRHCGATWLLVDPRHRELASLVAQLDPPPKLVALGANPNRDNVSFVADLIAARRAHRSLECLDMNGQALASLIYTSGTTGDPKGVMLSHDNLLSNTESIIEYLGLTNEDSIVNVLPFHYSYGNSVLHTHLWVGGRIVLENSMMYPQKVLESMEQTKVTGFAGVPSTFALMLSRTNLQDFDLSSVRYMTQAGGPMPPANVDRFTRELPHVQFFVMYGQTEATARLTYLPPHELRRKLGSCGIPIPGVEIEIRDAQGNPCPPGKTGEICARGRNIMLGYWNNEEATAKVLREGWLHTGDLAHQDEDGYIFIDGRASDMIKSGAHRISPQEIEEIIAELAEVAEVAVGPEPDEILGQVVKAAIVRKPGAFLDARSVQRHCMDNLPQYKIPRSVVFVDELPKTSSGKVQRHLL